MLKARLKFTPIYAILGLALASPGPAQELKLSVDDPRPLHDAIIQLRKLHGWLVTYQDPPYEHPDDVAPTGAMVGRDHATKYMAPRKTRISITYPEPKTGSMEERRQIVDEIVTRFNAAGAGQFRVYHSGAFSHVVPNSVKRQSGEVAGVTSVCDATASLPPARRTIFESVGLILSQISQQVGAPVDVGMVPMNLFLQRQYLTEARNENACDVLVRIFEDENVRRSAIGAPPVHVVWGMLYDATEKAYAFNVGVVQGPPPPSLLLGTPRIAK